MKKFNINKKAIIIAIVILLIIAIICLFTYKIINDETKLTVEEKEWITENINTVQNVHIPNNIDVFGKNGSGVLFDFIENLEEEYNVDVNLITYNLGEEISDKSFKMVYDTDEKDVVFFTEHYVVVSKEQNNVSSLSQLSNKRIGTLVNDEKILSKYLAEISNVSITPYESPTGLFEALNIGTDIDYIIVPLEENLTSILTSNYYISFHISDLNKYLVYETRPEDTFSNILKKYFYNWQEKNLTNSINKNELKTFVDALSISEKEIVNLQAKTYQYGFINNSPYELLISGSYGGIISEYIARFSAFSNTEFKYTKYKNFNKFAEAIANNKVDIFANYYNIKTDYNKVNSLINISFVIAARKQNAIVINSTSSLTGKTVYVLKNSLLEKYLNNLGGINIKTYADEKDLKKIAKSNKESQLDNLIIIDKENFEYYNKSILNNYNIRYTNVLSETYNFYVKNNDTFSTLLNKYIQTIDPEEVRIKGIYNHSLTIQSGTLLGKIAKYSLIVIFIILIIIYIAYRSSKKIKIAKKIKKEDKLKYIDQLTSLKNRNYLNENIGNWNKNTIYPQATIIIDLNQVQAINDTLGYEKGDLQIKAAANILIKTQLDNTDIMRTSGNEFLIYLVGYQEKQVVSYIRKLYKEFKTLPYEHGAAVGYSMISNDIKTIEDAINESVEDMRNKKQELEEG